jgi:hypothetical protein
MLFRNKEGLLVEINRYNYKNDSIYYNKVFQTLKATNCLNTISQEEKNEKKNDMEEDTINDAQIIFTSYSNQLVKRLLE